MSTEPLTQKAEQTTTQWGTQLWIALLVLSTALFLDALDVAMVGVALPSIGAELSMNTSSLQWVVGAYVLGYGGFLLLGGRAADLLGRKRMFLAALTLFTITSILGGIANDGTLLIAMRFLKGVAAAFTAPAALSIITTTFKEGAARNRALGIFATAGASGFSLGLVASGVLTELGWRWTFLAPAIVAGITTVLAVFFIPRGTAHSGERRYDVLGALTGTGAMLALVAGVVQAPEVGWGSPQTLITLGVAALLLTAFIVVEKRTPAPLLRLGILRAGSLVRANLGIVVLFGSYLSFQFVMMQYMQSAYGWSPLATALAFLPAGALVALTSSRVGAIATKHGTAGLIFVGTAAQFLGYLLLLRAGSTADLITVIIPGILLLGVAFALVYPSVNIQGTSGVADHEQGMAGGLLNTSMQTGGAVILAIATAVVSSYSTGEGQAPTLEAVHAATSISATIAGIGVLIAGFGVWRERRIKAEAQRVQSEAESLANERALARK